MNFRFSFATGGQGGFSSGDCLGKLYKNNSNEVTSQELYDYIRNNFIHTPTNTNNTYTYNTSFGSLSQSGTSYTTLHNGMYYFNTTQHFYIRVCYIGTENIAELPDGDNKIKFTVYHQTCRKRLC